MDAGIEQVTEKAALQVPLKNSGLPVLDRSSDVQSLDAFSGQVPADLNSAGKALS
jgi:hypothetical protein